MNRCEDCVYRGRQIRSVVSDDPLGDYECTHPEAKELSVISETYDWFRTCRTMRQHQCTREGVFFEARPPRRSLLQRIFGEGE